MVIFAGSPAEKRGFQPTYVKSFGIKKLFDAARGQKGLCVNRL
jgi:hypothetical protein